ncbi:MAG: hypothetical protein JWM34_4263 [Ilumatobacteraceae bacterium]|nr:hypothetical protein [Ilumatobacteraceae bacterium]
MPHLNRPTRLALKVAVLAVVGIVFVRPVAINFVKAVRDIHDVDVWLLVLAIVLQGFALFAYSSVTHAALGGADAPLSVWRVLRIQLSTRAFGGIVPAGGAAGPALGYRLLTRSGVPGRQAGFALGAAAMVSAVVLNLILWIGLVISIPIRGVHGLSLAAAVVGLLSIVIAVGVTKALIRGDRRIERPVLALARLLRRNEDTARAVLADLGERLRELTSNRRLLRRVAGWALANWAIDMLSLWVFLQAFEGTVRIDALLVAYGIGNILAAIPISPSGIGIVEYGYITTLHGFGMATSIATLGVTAYRFGHVLLPLPIGGLVYLSLRFGPWSIERSIERNGSQTTPSNGGGVVQGAGAE